MKAAGRTARGLRPTGTCLAGLATISAGLGVLGLLITLATANGQTKASEAPAAKDVIRAERREVVINVSVTDSGDAPVRGLQKQNFTLMDNGKPREIDAFGGAAEKIEAPGSEPDKAGTPGSNHSATIILDQVNAYFEDASYARQQVMNLLRDVPKDEYVALYTITRHQGLVLLQDYTTDRNLLLRSLQSNTPLGTTTKPVPGPVTTVGRGGARSVQFNHGIDQPFPPGLPDAVNASAIEMQATWHENVEAARSSFQELARQFQTQPGRKNIFWVGDAFPPRFLRDTEQLAWDNVIAELNEADVAVNTVDAHGVFRGANPSAGTIATMQEIADRTGGKAWFGRNDLDVALKEGITASRDTYTLRFHLKDDEPDNQFHTVKVIVDRARVNLFYRQGYYAGPVKPSVESGNARSDGEGIALALPYFYTGVDRARIHLTLDLGPDSGLKGVVAVKGAALRADGSEATRSSDSANIKAADAPWHYESELAIAAGSYTFELDIDGGGHSIHANMPLQIEPLTTFPFGVSSVVLGTVIQPAEGNPVASPLTAGGKRFIPTAVRNFGSPGPDYFYMEIYVPNLGDPNSPTPQIDARVTNRSTGEVKGETPMVDPQSHVELSGQTAKVAAPLPAKDLPQGAYRLEVRVGLTGGRAEAVSAIDFDVN